jgi:phosphoserine phosphatase
MTLVLTLIAAEALIDSTLSDLGQALQTDQVAWLAPGRAVDLMVTNFDRAEIIDIARQHLTGQKIDFVVQSPSGRRKKLLIADMDSTIVVGETLDELAAHAGLQERVAAITARSMNGEIDFKAALRERVSLLAGLEEQALAATDAKIELMPGARTLVATMRAHGAYTVLVSGGFDFFTSRVKVRCGLDEDRANRLIIENGRLTGRVVEPILDRDAKLAYLRSFAEERGLSADETLAVGDGANDLAMLREAGLGVAFRAKPVVAAEADFRVDHNDLRALLFAQGYSQEMFVGVD